MHFYQVEVLTSLKALHKFIDGSQLTAELDGSLPYSHSDWLQLPQVCIPSAVHWDSADYSPLEGRIGSIGGDCVRGG